MQDPPMIFNWAPYEGFFAGATLVLPQCNILFFQGVKTSEEDPLCERRRVDCGCGAGRPGRELRRAGRSNICRIGGVPMLERTIGAFAAHPRVDEILVVIHPDDAPLYRAASRAYAARLRECSSGGARRQDSVRAGLEALARTAPSSVLIHDAARPFVDAPLIARVIATLDAHDGALPCLPVTDTLKRVAARAVSPERSSAISSGVRRRRKASASMRSSPLIAQRRSESRVSSPTMPALPNGSASMWRWSKALRKTESSPRRRICAWPTSCCEAEPARAARHDPRCHGL